MILVILPVKNESAHIKKTALRLNLFLSQYLKEEFEILFIDDGSTDDSFAKIREIGISHIQCMRNYFDRGKGSALKAGFVLSNVVYRLEDNDIIIFMDGDGQIEPQEIRTFINLMQLYDSDVVIGNKRHTYSISNYGFIRSIVSSFYNLMARVLFGIRFQDTQCGLKIFKKYALDQVIEKITVKKFAFDLELLVALREMKMRVADAPITIGRQENAGSVSLKNIWQTFTDTIGIYRKMLKGFYKTERVYHGKSNLRYTANKKR